MITKNLLLAILLSIGTFGNIWAQDTIRDLHPPKHYYIPLSFGYFANAHFGSRYNDAVGVYRDTYQNAVSLKSQGITVDYNLYQRGKHEIKVGGGFTFMKMNVEDFYREDVQKLYDANNATTQDVTLKYLDYVDKRERYFGQNLHIEYNYIFSKTKLVRHSLGIQIAYTNYTTIPYFLEVSKLDYPNVYAQKNWTTMYAGKGQIDQFLLFEPKLYNTSSFTGWGFQLQYDLMYVHTAFNDLRVRGYYALNTSKGTDKFRFTNSIGIGAFVHIGRHFPKIDE